MGTPLQPTTTPLGEADLAKINQSLAHVEEGLKQVDLAERAGINVTQQKAQLLATQEQLTKIKQVYFPAGS